MFVDYVRECSTQITSLPVDTFGYCGSGLYVECPFYKIIKKEDIVCSNIGSCPIYAKFQVGDFEKFVKITKEYCLSDNKVKCERYILKKSGEEVPEDLLPDGNRFRE